MYWGTVFYKGQESANRLLCSSKIRIECTVTGFAVATRNSMESSRGHGGLYTSSSLLLIST